MISLRDGLDFTAAPALREHLIDVLCHSTDLLILDLSHVTSCDAAGLAVLIGTQRRAGLLGITMRLRRNGANPPGRLQRQRTLSGNSRSAACLLAAAVGVTVAAAHAMVLDKSGCSRISFSCHSACEF